MEAFLTKDGNEVAQSQHIKYTVFDDYVVIFIREVNKDDCGDYTITLKNESGSVKGNMTVYVTGQLLILNLYFIPC